MQSKRDVKLASRQRAVIFDFDGTIADSLEAVFGVFEDLSHRAGSLYASTDR